MMPQYRRFKIISGGQTGVDRAALDAALNLGLSCGGWCPKGRRAEDGPIDLRYPLTETDSAKYPVRTEKNVQEADGTLIIVRGPLKGGTALTRRLALKHHKPFWITEGTREWDLLSTRTWIEKNNLKSINIAGPRESESPGIYERALKFLETVLSPKVQSLYGGETFSGKS